MQPVLTSCEPLKINVQSCAQTSMLKWAMEAFFFFFFELCKNYLRNDFYDNDLRSYFHWSLTSVINSSSAPMCPCHCLQSPETTFSPRLTLKKRLVNHILGLDPRPQSVSVPADYSDCESPVLRAGSARAQRPLSWACVCSLQQCDSSSLAGNKKVVLHLVHWQLSDEGWKCWAALFMHQIKKWNSLIKCCLAFAFTALLIKLQRWVK